MQKYLVIMLGGALGAISRFIVATAIINRIHVRFPLGTFLVNMSGSFLIGVLMTVLTERFPLNVNWRLFLVVGILGGYTTFSSFEYETLIAAKQGDWLIALANAVGSLILGLLATWLGLLAAMKR